MQRASMDPKYINESTNMCIFILIYAPLPTYILHVLKASNVHFYHLLALGTHGSKMSKNQPKAIEMSRHEAALSSFQPMG